MRRRLRMRVERGERGAAAVEFALVSIPAIVLVLGAIQFGWYFYVSDVSSGAASTLARRMAVGDCWGPGQATTYAQSQAPQVSTVVTTPTSLAGGVPGTTQITVTVTASADILGFLPMPNGGTITKTVYTQLEDDQASLTCP